MRIVVIQSGPDYEVLLLMSLLIGLKKKYTDAHVVWIGEPKYFDLVQYNKRVNQCISISNASSLDGLASFFHCEICVNPSFDREAQNIASLMGAKQIFGFTKNGPANYSAEFFKKVMSGNLTTNKHVLEVYYNLIDMVWQGEGYGLNYYPRTKKTNAKGIYLNDTKSFSMPKPLLKQFDQINKYESIKTDDLFITHAAMALRKHVTFVANPLPYRIYFFGQGEQINP